MMDPGNHTNSIEQLNMGEGKTKVIVPMLAVSLADGKQVCRITVLKSLYETNIEDLYYRLGGLLNRRVYSIPCNRALSIGANEAQMISEVYQECMNKRGICVTLREHRLSLELKGYDLCRNAQIEAGIELQKCQKWIYNNCREILDEAEEIIHYKYQLIYTIGSQIPLPGSPTRWELFQGLLSLLRAIISEFPNLDQSDVEFTSQDKDETFPQVRFLKKNMRFERLCEKLVDEFLDRKCTISIRVNRERSNKS